MSPSRKILAALLTLSLTHAPAIAEDPPAEPGDLRVGVQEVVYEVRPDGSARPIDPRVHGVFDVRFEKQYDSVDHSSANLDFGLVYFAVPRGNDQEPNYNVYLYLRDESHEVVADGYRNNEVPGALFKLTTMLMKRDGDRAYARIMHCFAPQSAEDTTDPAGELATWKLRRKLDQMVAARLARH